jgi:hypothetical protein
VRPFLVGDGNRVKGDRCSSTLRLPSLSRFEALVGPWTTEATHMALPGAVERGDRLHACIDGVGTLEVTIV